MPRLPVDGKRVIEHRISLGSYERDRLDALVTGLTVRNVGEPVVALLSDVSALLALTAIAEAVGLIDLAGLARKGAGAGQQWMEAVLSGAYNSVQEALEDGQRILDEGLTIDIDVPGESFVRDTLSTGDKLWAVAQFLIKEPFRSVFS